MSLSAKGRRRIVVRGQTYIWYVALDDDSPYLILNIFSDDKYLLLSCPLHSGTEYLISKGRVFQYKETDGLWNRYLLPFQLPDIITPECVERLIVWAVEGKDAVRISINDVPL